MVNAINQQLEIAYHSQAWMKIQAIQSPLE